MTIQEVASIVGDAGSIAIPIVLAVIAKEWHRIDKTLSRLSDAIERLTERVDRLEERHHESSGDR